MEIASSTLAASDANPSDIISALQALQIKGVKDKDMEGILKEILEKHEVKEWENLLAAAPSALYAIGQCFLVALSRGMPQIMQKRDPTIFTSLQANLVHCFDLGLETFAEAEDTMADLRITITVITEYRGIMDKILDSVEDIKAALESKSDEEELKEISEELADYLGDLKKCAEECTKDTKSVVEKFTVWQSEVTKINLAFTETPSIGIESREKIKEPEDLLAELKEIEHGNENPNQLKKIGRWIKKKKDIETLQTTRSDLESGFKSLDARRMHKESVIKVLGDCLGNLKQIIESLELLRRFFKALYRQVEELSGQRLRHFIGDVTRKNLTQKKVDYIRFDAFKIRCQYMHAESKASIYVEASRKHIIPGVKFLHSLNSGVSDSEMEKRRIELDEFYEGALKGIHVFVQQLPTHAQLMKQIEDGALASEE